MLHYCKWFWFATVLSTCFYYGSFSASAISASAEAKKEDFQNSGISTLSNNFLQATQPHRHSAFNNTTSAQLENPGTPFSYSLEMDENQRIENSTNSSSSNTSPHPQIQSLTSNVTIVQLKTSLKPTISSVTIDENKMYEKASTSTSPITSLQSTQLETQALKTNAMIIKLQKVRKPFNSSMEADEIQMLGNSLLAIARRELADCDLVIALGPGFHSMQILSQLVELPHRRQVLIIASGTDLNNIHWKSTECRAYFFLWVETELLKTFTEVQVDDWDYGGRYVFVGPTLEQLNVLVASQKGKKTEHIVGIIQSQNRRQQWQIYMNLLYWGPGVERINTWKKNRFTGERNLFPDKISDLRGATLKAVAFVFAPSIMYFRDENGVVLYPYGIDVAIVNTLSAAVNFTVKYQEPPNDEKWGEKTERGWTGMMGLMKRDEADIGIADLFVSVTRTPVLDYTMPFDNEMSCVLLITEPPLPRWQALIFPFHLWTWTSIALFFLLAGPVLYFLMRGGRDLGETDMHMSFLYSFFYTFSMHLAKSHDQVPKRTSTQVYIAFLYIYCFILTVVYSTNLTAYLTVKKAPKSMETIQEVHDSGVHLVGMDDFFEKMLGSSPDPNLQDLSKTFEIYYNEADIIKRVLTGKGGYIGSKNYLEFIIVTRFTRRGVSKLRLMKECFAAHSIAIAVQKHSPIKRKFDHFIGWMTSGGIPRKFFLDSLRLAASTEEYGPKDNQPEDDEEGAEEGGILTPLSMDHMQGVFFILVLGWFASLLVFATERIIKREK